MFSVDYTLDIKAYQQYFSYQASHDKKIIRLCLTLIIACILLLFCISALITGINWVSLGITIIGSALLIILFPKFYWKVQFKRIDMMVAKMDLTYSPLKLTVDSDRLIVMENGKTIIIRDNQVNKMAFTHDYGFIFYNDNDKPATLIFPIESMTQQQLQSLILRY